MKDPGSQRGAGTYPPPALLIGGEWRERAGARTIVNPASGEVIGQAPQATSDDLADALRSAGAAFPRWRDTPASERASLLNAAAQAIRERVEVFALRLTLEQGKPLAESRVEFLLCAEAFEWYAAEAVRAYGRILTPRTRGARQMVVPEPIGPVLALTPWNFPALLAARKIAPALAAGCSCILKPAEETPAAALALAAALQDAGLPPGVLNVVMGEPAQISRTLIASPVIRKVSFTGSTSVGRAVAVAAAEGLKPCTLELGGHAPVIVLKDADAPAAAQMAAQGKIRNAGQVCTSPTRFFIERPAYESFVEHFAAAMATVVVGDGRTPNTMMGPLANPRRQEAMKALVGDALQKGATMVCGGDHGSNAGTYWRPTVLANVAQDAAIRNVEPFGPVATVQPFDDLDAAVAEANALPFGLAGYLFTQSAARAVAVSEALAVGVVGVNSFAVSQIEAPFSGVKDSGYGYEGGREGLEGYLHQKYIHHA